MARQITGTLKAPDGSVLAGAILNFIATRTELAGVPLGVTATATCDASGVYDVQLELGYYQVTLTLSGRSHSLGKILVESGSGSATVSALLVAGQPSLDTSLLAAVQEEVVAAEKAASGATASEIAAAAHAQTAENARDAAAVSAAIYADTAAGLAATVDGDYFKTLAAAAEGFLTLYRNDAGSATEIETFPSLSGVSSAVRVANQKATRLARSLQRAGDYGQSLHSDFSYDAYGVGSLMVGGVDTALDGDEMWTCTRATSKWVFQPSGPNGEMLLTEVPADTLARQWDPATGAKMGALLEQQRTNHVVSSDALLVTTEGGTAEKSGNSSVYGGEWTLLTKDAAAGDLVHRTSTLAGYPDTFTYSAHFKPGTFTGSVRVQVNDAGSLANLVYAQFDLSTEQLTSSVAGTFTLTGQSAKVYPDGSVRVSVSGTKPAGLDVQIRNLAVGAGSGEALQVGGYQFENGPTMSSYIPTNGAAVTRAADKVSLALGSEFNPRQFSGVLSFLGSLDTADPSSHLLALGTVDHSGSTPRVSQRVDDVGGHALQILDDGGSVWMSQAYTPSPNGEMTRVGFSVDAEQGVAILAVNGVTRQVVTGQSGTFANITRLWASSSVANARCDAVGYDLYPFALSQADLEARTA